MSVDALGTASDPVALDRISEKVTFTGDAGEYFGLCLKTIFLAVITLGIYDAWGTVYRRRYLLGHTVLQGHSFDYHANPITILKGRLIAVAVVLLLNVITTFYPPAGFAVGLLFVLGYPFFILRALAFHAGNTSYRNIRFAHEGAYVDALKAYVGGFFVMFVSLFLLKPVADRWISKFVVDPLRFGTLKFSTDIGYKKLFKLWFGLLLMFSGFQSAYVFTIAAVFGGAVGLYVAMGGDPDAFGQDFELMLETADPLIVFGGIFLFAVMGVVYLMGYVVIMQGYAAAYRNALLNTTSVDGGHGFRGSVPLLEFGMLSFGLGVAATLSFGLLIPWMQIVLRRYLLKHTEVLVQGDLDGVMARSVKPGGAAATEFGAMEGVGDGVFDGMV